MRAAIDADAARARLAGAARRAGARSTRRPRARLAPNDAQRIQRALEVWRVSGRPLSSWHAGRSAGARDAAAADLARAARRAPGCTRASRERFDGDARRRPDRRGAAAARARRPARRRCRRCARRLPAGVGRARRRRPRRACAPHGIARDAPARQAPADLAARRCRRATSSPATRPTRSSAGRRSPRGSPSAARRLTMALLEVDGLAKRYGEATVFDERRSLDVAAGEFVAVARRVGRRQVDPAQLHRRPRPRRRRHGAHRRHRRARARRRRSARGLRRDHLGFVFQAFHVLPHLTVAAQRRPAAAAARPRPTRRASARCSTRSASAASARACRRRSRAASCSGSRSRARWCTGRADPRRRADRQPRPGRPPRMVLELLADTVRARRRRLPAGDPLARRRGARRSGAAPGCRRPEPSTRSLSRGRAQRAGSARRTGVR